MHIVSALRLLILLHNVSQQFPALLKLAVVIIEERQVQVIRQIRLPLEDGVELAADHTEDLRLIPPFFPHFSHAAVIRHH